jgi:hypothetical protein
MNIKKRLGSIQSILRLAILFVLVSVSVSQAHMMVAQHGTLNVVDGGVFMVISLPVSAFSGIDNNNDGKLSLTEFNQHRAYISEEVRKNVVLKDHSKELLLQGLILSPVVSHSAAKTPATQLIIMGKFQLNAPDYKLNFQLDLFGKNKKEQSIQVTATDRANNNKHVFILDTDTTKTLLFR